MKTLTVSIWIAFVILLSFSGPAAGLGLADGFPFCAGGGAPQIAQLFQGLAAQLGDRIGQPAECEHPETATGDVQQRTSTGLLYWRKSTNTPTFTDGAVHWALRGTQLLQWTTTEADPPQTALVSEAQPMSIQPSSAQNDVIVAGSSVAASGVLAAAVVDGQSSGTSVLIWVLAVGLVVVSGTVVLLVRRRPGGGTAGVPRRSGLVAAAAILSDPGLAATTGSPAGSYVPTVPVQELEGTLHGIGRNRVTQQADVVLRSDVEPMTWEASPAVAAVLLPAVLKWLLVVALTLVLGGWVQSAVSGPGNPPSARDNAATLQWWLVVIVVCCMAFTLLVTFVRLQTTTYRGSRQRLEITTGVFNQKTLAHELYELRDWVILRPLHYRMFGVGSLRISHRTKPPILLEAIVKPESVRDLLRASGQIEAARFEKAAWR